MSSADAVVVGAGPNGLSAAIALARAGLRVRVHEAEATIGGGTRSAQLTLPGFLHDVCSAIHPMAAASPFFAELPLAAHGLSWTKPDVALAHPFDDGSAAMLASSIEDTAGTLGEDAAVYRRIIAPLASRFPELAGDILSPLGRMPRHPLLFMQFAARAVLPAKIFAFSALSGERSRALFAGLAAHSFLPLDAPLTMSVALVLAAAAHASGWPIARGGSQRIAEALSATFTALGGEIVVGDRVETLDQLGEAHAVLFDTSPAILERIAADRLPPWYRRRLRRWAPGPGIFKIDYALEGPMPWRAPECRRAGTVHVGGTFAEIASSEGEVARGGHPKRPFVLVAQQSLFDETRAPAGSHTLWVYCHVPNGSTIDMTARIEAQLERFAPGFSELVLSRAVTTPREVEAYNANCFGGDISGGGRGALSLVVRPGLAFDPHATPARELYLCSASTPPGAGVHGMCGYHAATSALRRTFGI